MPTVTRLNGPRLKMTGRGIAAGVRLFRDMYRELADKTMDENGRTAADACQFDAEHRGGKPFRSIALEYLIQAQQAGPGAVAGFMACCGDMAACAALGFHRDGYGKGATSHNAVVGCLADEGGTEELLEA